MLFLSLSATEVNTFQGDIDKVVVKVWYLVRIGIGVRLLVKELW